MKAPGDIGMGIVMWYDAIVRERPADALRGAAPRAMVNDSGAVRGSRVLLHDEPASTTGALAAALPTHPSLLAAMLTAETASHRQQTVTTLLHALGFERLGYGRFAKRGEPYTPMSFCTTYADRPWAERYFDAWHHEIDPRLQQALRSSLPAVWALDQLAAQAATDAPHSRLRRFVAELGDTGMRSGIILALPGAINSDRYIVSFLSRTPGSGWMGDGLVGQVLTLALCLHEFYTRYAALPQPSGAPAPTHTPLTAMQREIMACVSQGLGDKAIAGKLGIGLHNVDYHMRQLRKRFGVRNRVQLMQAMQNEDWA
jgi:DNA-binding CsgD family transcriptional regulator